VTDGLIACDLLGSPLSEAETRLLAVYQELKELCEQDLVPVARCNVQAALALINTAVTSLALEFEHLTDLGV
jgi:hypothetical protein